VAVVPEEVEAVDNATDGDSKLLHIPRCRITAAKVPLRDGYPSVTMVEEEAVKVVVAVESTARIVTM
jgi:hypothetical protein